MWTASAAHAQDKPNILAIWGDDIGVSNLGPYNHTVMGSETPNIDNIAQQSVMFTDHYSQVVGQGVTETVVD